MVTMTTTAEATYTMRLELAERRRMLMKALARRPAGKESRLFQKLSSSATMATVPTGPSDVGSMNGCGGGGSNWETNESKFHADDSIEQRDDKVGIDVGNRYQESDDSPMTSSKKFRYPVVECYANGESAPPLLSRLSDSSEDSASLPPLTTGRPSSMTMQRRWDKKCKSDFIDNMRDGDPSCSASFQTPQRPQEYSRMDETITTDDAIHPSGDRHKPLFTPSLSDIVRREIPITMVDATASTTTDRQMADLRKARLKRCPSRPPLERYQRLFLETRIHSKQRTTLIVGSPARRQSTRNILLHYDTDDEREDVPIEERPSASTPTNCDDCGNRSHGKNGDVQEFFKSLLTASDDPMPSDEDPKSFDTDDDDDDTEPHPSLEGSDNGLAIDNSTDNTELLKEDVAKLDLVIDMSQSSMCSSEEEVEEKRIEVSTTACDQLDEQPKDTTPAPSPISRPVKVYRFYEPEASSNLHLLLGSFMDRAGIDSIDLFDGSGSKSPSLAAEDTDKDANKTPSFGLVEVKDKLEAIIQEKPAWKSISDQYRPTAAVSYSVPSQHSKLSILEALSLSSDGASNNDGGLIDNSDLIRTLSSGSDSIAASFEALIADLQGLVSESNTPNVCREDPKEKTIGEAFDISSSENMKPADVVATTFSTKSDAGLKEGGDFVTTNSHNNDTPSFDHTISTAGLAPLTTTSTGTPSFDRKRIIRPSTSGSREEGPSMDQSDDFKIDSSIELGKITTVEGFKQKQKTNPTLTRKGGAVQEVKGEESETPLVSNAKRFSFTEDGDISQESSEMQGSSTKSFDNDADDVEHLERTLIQIKAVLKNTEKIKKIITKPGQDDRAPPTKVISFTPKSQRGAIEVEFLPKQVNKILSTTNESLDRLSFERTTISDRPSAFNGFNLTVTSSLTENTAEEDDDESEEEVEDDDDSSSSSSSSSDSGDDISLSSDEEIASTVPSEILTRNSILQSCSMDPHSVLANVESNDENDGSGFLRPDGFKKRTESRNEQDHSCQALVVPTLERTSDAGTCSRALTEITAAILCRCTGPVHSPRADESFDATGREIVVVETNDRIYQLV